MANAIPRCGAVGGGWSDSSEKGAWVSGTRSRRSRMRGTLISMPGAEWSRMSYTCSLPRLVRMISLAPRPAATMLGSYSSLSTGSISQNDSRSVVMSDTLMSPRSTLSLTAFALRPSGPRLVVETMYILVLQYENRVVAISEEKIARAEVSVVQLAVDVGELVEIRGDRVGAHRGDDDDGRVTAAPLGALRRELVVAPDRGHPRPVFLAEVAPHARRKHPGGAASRRPVAVLLGVGLERPRVHAQVVHDRACAGVD